jgi:hypothetical protein
VVSTREVNMTNEIDLPMGYNHKIAQRMRYLVRLEADISYKEKAMEGEPEIGYRPGKKPVIISAPHGASHFREGYTENDGYKDEDEFTGAIAQFVAKRSGAHLLYLRRRTDLDPNKLNTIPNEINEIPYKRKIAEIVNKAQNIKFLIDLHGAKADNHFAIGLGTIDAKHTSCKQEYSMITQLFKQYGFSKTERNSLHKLVTNPPRKMASEKTTITRYSHDVLKISSIQLEINAEIRIPKRRLGQSTIQKPFYGYPERIYQLTEALVALVNVLAKED